MSNFERVIESSESFVKVELPPHGEFGGRLKFDPEEGPTLEVIDPHSKSWAYFESSDHDRLLGTMAGGSPFTLIGCHRKNTKAGGGGVLVHQLGASSLIVGTQLLDERAPLFEKVQVSLSHLNDWFGVLPVRSKLEDLPSPGKGRRATVSCEHLPPLRIASHAGGPELSSEQYIGSSWGQGFEGKVSSQFLLNVVPAKPITLDQCIDEHFSIQSFFSLLCGRQCFFEQSRIYVRDPEISSSKLRPLAYLPRFAQPRQRKRRHA